jgi:peptidyl-prolyl cis-trans isomerase C
MNKYLLKCVWSVVVVAVLISGCKSEEKYVSSTGTPKETVSQQPVPAAQPSTAAVPAAQPTPVVKPVKAAEPNVAAQPVVPADPNAVIVTINGENILQSQLDSQVNPILSQRQAAGQQPSQTLIDQMKSQMLYNIVTETIVQQQFKTNKIDIVDNDIDDYIKKMLSTTEPPMTVEDLKTRISQTGRTYEQWREAMGFKKRLQMEKLLEIKFPEQMKVADEEAKKFYDENPKYFQTAEQVRASHILVKVDKTDPCKVEQLKADAKKKIQGILDEIKKGADFAETAKKYSDCPSAKNGGDLYYFEKNTMVPEFANVAFSLKIGEISDIVETTYGYHIIKVTDHREASTIPFEKMKANIIDSLKSKKEETLVGTFLDKLRDEASIVYPSGSTLRAYVPAKSEIKKPLPAATTTPAQKQPANTTAGQPPRD